MLTCEKVVETLANIGVTKEQIDNWERFYALKIPQDKNGRKLYNDNHLKLFKAIKKHLAIGYSLADIKQKLNLEVKPVQQTQLTSQMKSAINPMRTPHPQHQQRNSKPEDHMQFFILLERLMEDKDKLVKDKDFLMEHIHLLEMHNRELEKIKTEYEDQISKYINQIEALEEQLLTSIAEIQVESYVDSWVGKAKLLKIIFDTVGIDIPKERNKSFKVTDPPKRLYGNMVVFMSSFKSDEDPLWERIETYRVAYINEEELKGELDVEYFVDNVPVAKAIYTISCYRKTKQQEG